MTTTVEEATKPDERDTQIATLTQHNRVLMAQRDLIGKAFLAQTDRLYMFSVWRGAMTRATAIKAAEADAAKVQAAIEKIKVDAGAAS